MVAPQDPAERAKLERRRQILGAAKLVFAEAGYHGATIGAIIERAQIARHCEDAQIAEQRLRYRKMYSGVERAIIAYQSRRGG